MKLYDSVTAERIAEKVLGTIATLFVGILVGLMVAAFRSQPQIVTSEQANQAQQTPAPIAAGWSPCFGLYIQLDDPESAARMQQPGCTGFGQVRIGEPGNATVMTLAEFRERVFGKQ